MSAGASDLSANRALPGAWGRSAAGDEDDADVVGRRGPATWAAMLACIVALGAGPTSLRARAEGPSSIADTSNKQLGIEDQPRLRGQGKRRTKFPNFTVTDSGLQVKQLVEGREGAPEVKTGDIVVLDWEGYTINYFGRPFETRTLNEQAKVQVDPLRFKVGDGTVIPAIDEAVRGMREGAIRQLVVPVELGYDENKLLKPRPSTFSGQRALDFVLDNKGGLMDKTLLININLKRTYQGT